LQARGTDRPGNFIRAGSIFRPPRGRVGRWIFLCAESHPHGGGGASPVDPEIPPGPNMCSARLNRSGSTVLAKFPDFHGKCIYMSTGGSIVSMGWKFHRLGVVLRLLTGTDDPEIPPGPNMCSARLIRPGRPYSQNFRIFTENAFTRVRWAILKVWAGNFVFLGSFYAFD